MWHITAATPKWWSAAVVEDVDRKDALVNKMPAGTAQQINIAMANICVFVVVFATRDVRSVFEFDAYAHASIHFHRVQDTRPKLNIKRNFTTLVCVCSN